MELHAFLPFAHTFRFPFFMFMHEQMRRQGKKVLRMDEDEMMLQDLCYVYIFLGFSMSMSMIMNTRSQQLLYLQLSL